MAAARPDTFARCLDDAEATMDETGQATNNGAVRATFGRYEVLRVLGRGATGIVWAARDPDLDRAVAIKALMSEAVTKERAARIRIEAVALAQLNHPHIVPIYDVGEVDGTTFIVMEWIRGQTLRQWLEQPHSIAEVIELFMAIGQGLTSAHRLGLVHRDFKPDNVLIDGSGRPLVVDFGLARNVFDSTDQASLSNPLSSASEVDTALTKTGAMLGTPAYMAPEQFELGDVDARTDIFAFTATLFEALAGHRPFRGESMLEHMHQVLHADRALVGRGTSIPARVRTVLQRGLAVRPADRFATMDDLLTALRRVRPRWRFPALGSALVAGGLIAGTVFGSALATTGESRPSVGSLSAATAEIATTDPAVDPWLQEAEDCERAGDLEGVLEATDRILALTSAPDPLARAQLLRARVLQVLERWPEAQAAASDGFDEALQLDDDDLLAELAVLSLQAAVDRDRASDRLETARSRIVQPSPTAQAWLDFGDASLTEEQGDPSKTIARLRHALGNVDDETPARLIGEMSSDLALILARLQTEEQGCAMMRRGRDAVAREYGSRHAYAIEKSLLVADCFMANDTDRAREELERTKEDLRRTRFPNDTLIEAHRDLQARFLFVTGHPHEALAALDGATEDRSGSSSPRPNHEFLRVQIYNQLGQHGDAYRVSRRFLDHCTKQLGPQNELTVYVRLLLASAEFGLGRLDEAEADYGEVVHRSVPGSLISLTAKVGVAEVDIERQRYRRAIASLVELIDALERKWDSEFAAEARRMLAVALARTDRRDEAEAEFRRALAALPKAGPTYERDAERIRDSARDVGVKLPSA
jgi:tetratricopeptide (TPR) repeat protein/predicted Ser/Thr protein kinase